MKTERFRWLAGVIAAHPEGRLVGRTRLQKTMSLLQRLGMPCDYEFKMHFYGPYSEGIQADMNLLTRLGFVNEEVNTSKEGVHYSVFAATAAALLPELAEYRSSIDVLAKTEAVVLELAATLDAYRQQGLDDGSALQLVRLKKGEKCESERLDKAIILLKDLGL